MRGKFIVMRKRRDTGVDVLQAEYIFRDEQDRTRQHAKAQVCAINCVGYIREVLDADPPAVPCAP